MSTETTGTKKRSGPARLVYKLLIPVFLLGLVYYFLMQPSNIKALVQTIFHDYTEARIELDVERASLIYGFEFRNLNLIDGRDDTPLFSASRVRLSWFLPSILIGHVGVRELAIEDPHLYIIKNKGRWNWTSVVSPEDDDDEETVIPDQIDLLLNFRVYANLKISNFALTMRIREDGSQDAPTTPAGTQSAQTKAAPGQTSDFQLELKRVNLRLAAITRHFSTIPLDLRLLDLFDTLILALNPYQPIGVSLKTNAADPQAASLAGAARLTYFLFRETDQGVTEFASRLKANTTGLTVRRGGATPRSPALSLRYDTRYDATRDRLLIPVVAVDYAGDRWLRMDAEVHNATTPRRTLRLDVSKSRIDLGPIGGVLSTLLGDGKRPLVDGVVTISKLGLKGDLERLNLSGNVAANQIRIAPGSGIDVLRDFQLDLTALMDLYRLLPFIDKPEGYTPDANLAFGVFHRLLVSELRAIYGTTRVKGDAAITPEAGVRANLDVANFKLESVLPEILRGNADAKVRIASPENFNRMDFDGTVRLRDGRYFLDRSRSGLHNLNLTANGALLFQDNFTIDIDKLRLTGSNPEGSRLAALDADGRIVFADDQIYDINVKRLTVNYESLHSAFPGSIRYIMAPYKIYLSQGVQLKSKFQMRIADEFFGLNIKRGSILKVPFLKLEDLDIEADMRFGDRDIRMRPVRLRGLRGALAVDASADLTRNKAGDWKPKADIDLRVARENLFRVHENIALQGSLRLNAKVDDDQARGKVDIQNLDLQYDQGLCSGSNAGPECYRLAIRRLNLDLPFVHELSPDRILSLAENAGRDYQDTYGRTGTPNLTVMSVASSHRPNGEFSGQSDDRRFHYVGRPGKQALPAVAAVMNYRNNIVFMDWLRLTTYKKSDGSGPPGSGRGEWKNSGTVDGRSVFFNLADLQPKNMELGLNVQIQDLDLEPFLPGRNRYQAEISGDLKWKTASLKDFLYNTEALASIHEIEDDFSGFVTRILLPTQVAALIVNNTLSIPRIRAEVKGGLVYSYVSVRRGGALGYLVKPGGEEIKQERMPIAQFLERARNELGTRRRDDAAAKQAEAAGE
ncbi:MAG: AsmA family protein [bacterium]|nr:AsmA family protein [bacterium]